MWSTPKVKAVAVQAVSHETLTFTTKEKADRDSCISSDKYRTGLSNGTIDSRVWERVDARGFINEYRAESRSALRLWGLNLARCSASQLGLSLMKARLPDFLKNCQETTYGIPCLPRR